MKTLIKLDHTGDTRMATPEFSEEQLRATFEEHVGKKLPAFSTKRPNGQPDQKITSFDQVEDGAETILVPAVVAG